MPGLAETTLGCERTAPCSAPDRGNEHTNMPGRSRLASLPKSGSPPAPAWAMSH